jgi:hypothetical protein
MRIRWDRVSVLFLLLAAAVIVPVEMAGGDRPAVAAVGLAPVGLRVTGPVGSCAGGPVERYRNGRIPRRHLCPVRGRPGHHLRADAAHAVNRLSRAYRREFGTRLCITDSYRSYARQVDVYERKPELAVTPGTSMHGWGVALDLCGGVQDFDSVQHRWMAANAASFGWHLPLWATRTGHRPEPWHWEFAI